MLRELRADRFGADVAWEKVLRSAYRELGRHRDRAIVLPAVRAELYAAGCPAMTVCLSRGGSGPPRTWFVLRGFRMSCAAFEPSQVEWTTSVKQRDPSTSRHASFWPSGCTSSTDFWPATPIASPKSGALASTGFASVFDDAPLPGAARRGSAGRFERRFSGSTDAEDLTS